MRRAVCNEMFGNQEFAKTCGLLKTCGFEGVEIAPYTLSNVNGYFSTSTLAQIRSTLEAHELAFAGFHWLFAHPSGLHITTADPLARRKALDHLKGLLFAAGELGGGNLILGSPKQRSVSDATPEEGLRRLADFLVEAATMAVIPCQVRKGSTGRRSRSSRCRSTPAGCPWRYSPFQRTRCGCCWRQGIFWTLWSMLR
jgi:sugar phosphate isomerase/epimerase